MKHPLLLLAILVLSARGIAQASAPLPADTLPGHARLVRTISATLCAELSSPQAPDLDQLSPPAALQYAQKLFASALRRDSVQLHAMMKHAAPQGQSPTDVARLLGRDALLAAATTCPAAQTLAARLVQAGPVRQALAVRQPPLPPAEEQALLPVASALCHELQARNARAPFGKLTPAERQRVYMEAVQKSFRPQTAALNRFYGPAKLDALLRSGEFDGRVARLMASRGLCTEYLVLIGTDRPAPRRKP